MEINRKGKILVNQLEVQHVILNMFSDVSKATCDIYELASDN